MILSIIKNYIIKIYKLCKKNCKCNFYKKFVNIKNYKFNTKILPEEKIKKIIIPYDNYVKNINIQIV